MSSEPEILFYPSRAASPSRACPHGAVDGSDRDATIDRAVCAACDDRSCERVSKHPAFEWAGLTLSPADVLDRAMRARPLFGRAGGVTFGGGEATLLGERLDETIAMLEAEGIDAAVETNASTGGFERLVGTSALLICDVKCVDGARHEEWTGVGNDAALANVRRAAREHERLKVRVPLVTGFNDDADAMRLIAGFVGELVRERRDARGAGLGLDVLPLHHVGEPKYAALGLEYPMAGVTPPAVAEARAFAAVLSEAGAEVTVAGRDVGGKR